MNYQKSLTVSIFFNYVVFYVIVTWQKLYNQQPSCGQNHVTQLF